jgi:hypothetical protein
MMEKFNHGLGLGSLTDGALRSLPEPLRELLDRLSHTAGNGRANGHAPAKAPADGAEAPAGADGEAPPAPRSAAREESDGEESAPLPRGAKPEGGRRTEPAPATASGGEDVTRARTE